MKDAFSVTRLSFWTGVMLSSLVGGLLYAVTARSIEREAKERFDQRARYAQSVIAVRIKSYTDLLRGVGSMLQSTDRLDHRAFHDYVRGLELDKHFAAVDSFNFAIYMTDAQRKTMWPAIQNELRHVLGAQAAPAVQPPGTRADYLVVSYIEPDSTNPAHYGVDLLTNQFFNVQLLRSRDDGTLYASGSPVLPLSRPNDIHLGLRLPIYRSALPPESVEQRRAAFAGSLGIAFSVPKLLHGVMEEMHLTGVRMTLYDIGPSVDRTGRTTQRPPRLLFDSAGAAPGPEADEADDTFSRTLQLDFNGRPWRTTYTVPKLALYSDIDIYYPKLMMGFGFLGSILLYALLHMLTTSRQAALALAREMTSELRESQHKLQLSHQKLRRMADHAYQIKELERKRIAREIHDDLGQNLLALRIEAELLANRTKGTHAVLHQRARATLQQIDTTIKSVRQIINDLRPTVLDLGLSAAVEWQVSQFQHRTGIECKIDDNHGEISLPDHCATAFFRILQESLTNIVRHAGATRVIVELHLEDGWLTLTVSDNGCGLQSTGRAKHDSFGLVGIEERIAILGGTCAVVSGPAGGTTVTVSAPVARPQEPALPEHLERASGSAVL